MKKLLLLAALVLGGIAATAQTEIGVGYVGAKPTGKPKNVDLQSALGGMYFVGYGIKVHGSLFVDPQLQLLFTSYIMDGYFTHSSADGYRFGTTPDNYKQSSLTFTTLRLPLLVNYCIGEHADGTPMATFGIGPYAEYVLSAQQRFKIGQSKIKEKAPIEQPLQEGLVLDLGVYGRKTKQSKHPIAMHVGGSYQLSSYLKDRPSFRPFLAHICLSKTF